MEFLTREEKQTLEARLAALIDARPSVSQRIAEARALGDLKENAEYHAARDDQGMAEAEIRRLELRIAGAQVADEVEKPADMVFLGTVVKLKDLDDNSDDLYKVVGEATGGFDSDEIEVTATSPLGAALMKARVGEEIKASLPRGDKRFSVLAIM